jgi:(p)ppGpp synthase/HD superfamily hydrolase
MRWLWEYRGIIKLICSKKESNQDETVYVMTPQGRVVDLPRGATPVDFAYPS